MTGYNAKRKMSQAKLDDDDDTQVYGDALTAVYQRGFADGKAAQRKPLTDERVYKMWDDKYRSWIGGEQFESIVRAVEQAHGIKERT